MSSRLFKKRPPARLAAIERRLAALERRITEVSDAFKTHLLRHIFGMDEAKR